MGESPGSVRLKTAVCHLRHPLTLSRKLFRQYFPVLRKIQKVNSAVQPRCKDCYTPKCSFGIIQPVNIKIQQFIYNSHCRMKHDLKDHCRRTGGDRHRKRIRCAENLIPGKALLQRTAATRPKTYFQSQPLKQISG